MNDYLFLLETLLLKIGSNPKKQYMLFNEQIEFDAHTNILPFILDKNKTVVKELLWTLTGSSDASELNKEDIHHWDKVMVNLEDVLAFAKEHNLSDDDTEVLKGAIGSIGPMYGSMWRNLFINKDNSITFSQLASDKQKQVKELNDTLGKATTGDDSAINDITNQLFGNCVDQMQSLIYNIKNRVDTNYVVSSYVVDNLPILSKSPQHNVLIGRCGAEPNVILQEYFISEGTINGVRKLSLILTISNLNMLNDYMYITNFYYLLLKMVAQCACLIPDKLIISIRKLYFNIDDRNLLTALLMISKDLVKDGTLPATKMLINPYKNDLFDFELNDFVTSISD
jgi:thymidylate synthase